jgi:hypothetical protein
MAEKITRTFWIIPGDLDKDGHQKEYTEKPSTFVLSGLGLAKQPVQITEEMSPDGEYIQYTSDAEGKRTEISRGVDKARLQLYEARQREQPKKQTEDEKRLDKANADVAEANANKARNPQKTVVNTDANEPNIVYSDGTSAPNPNYRKPPMINRGSGPTPGTNPAVDDPRSQTADIVPEAQANYDLKQRQMTLEEAKRQDELAQQKLLNDIAQKKLTSDQAIQQLTAIREGLALKLQEAGLGLTARGQDISVRNADLDAGVSQRGQNLSFAASQARGAEGLAAASLPYLAPAGTRARLDYILGSDGDVAGAPKVQNTPFPYNPATFGNGVAQAAMQMAPPMVMGAPVAAASIPSVSGDYQRALGTYQQQVPQRMVLGG